jgi:hypothetical protein
MQIRNATNNWVEYSQIKCLTKQCTTKENHQPSFFLPKLLNKIQSRKRLLRKQEQKEEKRNNKRGKRGKTCGCPGGTETQSLHPCNFSSGIRGLICTATFTQQSSPFSIVMFFFQQISRFTIAIPNGANLLGKKTQVPEPREAGSKARSEKERNRG